VNGSTASASEITAAALKDHGKATIVGTKTYGKGVVQKIYNLSGGSILKVTTAEWLTPNGNSINNNGVTPDIEIDITSEDINKMRDPQLDKAKTL
jgi:carboxyl-terminal processing protease